MRVLILGVSGMLGSAMFRVMHADPKLEVLGHARSPIVRRYFPAEMADRIVCGADVENIDALHQLFAATRPQVVVNCVGLVKQLADADDPLRALPVNSLLPHRLARLCEITGARLIHFSTDCVFSGRHGSYLESDASDAEDLYGRSKYLGEVDYPNAVTLRTSIVGEELGTAHGLVSWFLSQRDGVKGYTRAIFSGLTTLELSKVVAELVLPRPALRGVYQVAADPISKFDLLSIVNKVYERGLDISPQATPVIDRSLNGGRFATATGYRAAPWRQLITQMRDFHAGDR